MPKERMFKCGFKHCEHEDKKVPQSEAIRIGNRYWHSDCREIADIISDISDLYKNHISSSVVYSILGATINDIVFGKKLRNDKVPKYQSDLEAAKYLYFALDYAITNRLPITHVQGMYYLIDNAKVKKAYQKKKELEAEKEMRAVMNEESGLPDLDLPDSATTSFSPGRIGFGSILKGSN